MKATDSFTVTEQVKQYMLGMPMARTLGLSFTRLAPREVEIEVPIPDAFCLRPGQLQATAVAAAGTLLKPGWVNATLKIAAPTRGHCLRAGAA